MEGVLHIINGQGICCLMDEFGNILNRITIISRVMGEVVIARFKPVETIFKPIGALAEGDILIAELKLITLAGQMLPIGKEAVKAVGDICIRKQHKYKTGGHFPCYNGSVLDMGPVQAVVKVFTQTFLKLKKLTGINGIQLNAAHDTGRVGGQGILFFKCKHMSSFLYGLL